MRRTRPGPRCVVLILIVSAVLLSSIGGLFGCQVSDIFAQSGNDVWGEVSNLSRSGAATSPRVIAQPDGAVRVLWWDQFDGVTMVQGRPGTWSEPIVMPIQVVRRLERPAADGRETELVPIAAMPMIYDDATGRAHALWLGEMDDETGATPLMGARLESSSLEWTTPREVTAAAVGLDVATDISNTLHLVYVRDLSTSLSPSGVYYRKSTDGGATWSQAVQVHASQYYRLLSAQDADVDVVALNPETLVVTWYDPYSDAAYVTESSDAGGTWRDPVLLDDAFGSIQRGLVVASPGVTSAQGYLLWQDSSPGVGCTVYQAAVENLYDNARRGSASLDTMTSCIDLDSTDFLQVGLDKTLMISSGPGEMLLLAIWTGESWSDLRSLPVRFEESDEGTLVGLRDLHAVPASVLEGGTTDTDEELVGLPLVVAGIDDAGDVWAATTAAGLLDIVFAPPSPWSDPELLSTVDAMRGLSSLVTDSEGQLHLMWAEVNVTGEEDSVLRYARRDNDRWSSPVAVLRSPEGGATAPDMIAHGSHLHVLWSGGASGRIWYSRAFVEDAHTESGWLEPELLSELVDLPADLTGSRADLASLGDAMHAVFAVPVNEGRGIYYTHSVDGGETWSSAEQVFDAVDAGWAKVDNPRLAVGYQGVLNVVWEQSALSRDDPAQGVYYAWSDDGGETWVGPNVVEEGDFGNSDVIVSAPGQVHLLWQDTSGGGTWWHRWKVGDAAVDLEEQGAWAGWRRMEQVVGLGGVQGPLGMVADGAGRFHLVGWRVQQEYQPELVHTLWTGESWEQQESLSPAFFPGEGGVSASLQPATGQLSVVLSGALPADGDVPEAGLWYAGRAVQQVETQLTVVPRPSPTPLPSPTPTPVVSPQPTADLGDVPPPQTGRLAGLPFALLLGGGFAALIVLGVSGVRLLRAVRV